MLSDNVLGCFSKMLNSRKGITGLTIYGAVVPYLHDHHTWPNMDETHVSSVQEIWMDLGSGRQSLFTSFEIRVGRFRLTEALLLLPLTFLMCVRIVSETWFLQQVWKRLFQDRLGEPPKLLSAPCCSEFLVSRSAIRTHPKEFYVHLRDWLLQTQLSG